MLRMLSGAIPSTWALALAFYLIRVQYLELNLLKTLKSSLKYKSNTTVLPVYGSSFNVSFKVGVGPIRVFEFPAIRF